VLRSPARHRLHHRLERLAKRRSIAGSESVIGCWSEQSHFHFRSCCVLPDEVDPVAYCGSLVNVITPYAFWQQAKSEGHGGVLITAGTSATGIAMLGLGLAGEIPIVSIARNEAGKQQLLRLGAKHVVVQNDPDFETDLARAAEANRATEVFDGVGGELLTRIAPHLPRECTVSSYGYLGGNQPFAMATNLLMTKKMTLTSFSNFGSPTARDPRALESALANIGRVLAMPHFRTRRGRAFSFEEIQAAIAYEAGDGGKAVLLPR
jgi:NADPH2:quinone reductase